MNFKKIVSTRYFSSFFSTFIIALLGFVNSILINRFLGPSLKGEYTVILNIVNFATLILNFGIYQSYVFYKKRENKPILNTYVNNIFLQFFIYIFIALFLSIFSFSFNLKIAFILIPSMVLVRQLSFITILENIKLRNKLAVVDMLLYTFLLILFFVSYSSSVFLILLALLVKNIFYILLFIIKFNLKPNPLDYDISSMVKAIKFGMLPMLTLLLINMNYKVDIFILDMYVSKYQIGLYSIGVLFAEQIWLISETFKNVLYSRENKKNIRETLLLIKINIFLSVFAFLFFFFLGENLISFLYGHEFIGAAKVTVIIFTGVAGMSIFKVLHPYYVSNGHVRIAFIILLISVSINVVLNIILIPKFGIVGAAISSIVSYIICGIWFLVDFKFKEKIKFLDFLLIKKSEILYLKNYIFKK